MARVSYVKREERKVFDKWAEACNGSSSVY